MPRTPILALIPLLIGGVVWPAGPVEADVIEAIEGDFAEDVVAVEVEGGEVPLVRTAERSIPLDRIKRIVVADEDPSVRSRARRAYFRGGDSVRVQIAGSDDRRVEMVVPALDERVVHVPIGEIRGLADFEDVDGVRWFEEEVLPEDEPRDVVLLTTGDDTRVQGGILRIGPEGVRIEARGLGELPIEWDRIRGVRLARSGRGAGGEGLRVRATLRDGSTVTGPLVGWDEGSWRVRTAWAGELELSEEEVLDLAVLGGKLVYLSDLDPAEVDEGNVLLGDGPALFPMRRDRSCTGRPIVLDGRTYRKGLGVHARSEITWELDGEYVEFRAVCGLDDQVYELARQVTPEVVFQVRVDGEPVLGEDGEGLRIGLHDMAQPIRVDLEGAETLRLEVTAGRNFEILARADWADAYLIRE